MGKHMLIGQAEFNTLVTFLGMLCASVQGVTGFYAAYLQRRAALLKTNDILARAHRAFGGFSTALYAVGLMAGLTGLIGALTINNPPMELNSPSFNIHTWGSFIVLGIVGWKTAVSYFNKKRMYRKKWLGIAMFLAWAYTWVTAVISYYVRTLPSNPQHPAPTVLLPYSLMGVQIAIPFVLGGGIGWWIVRRAKAWQAEQDAKRARRAK